MGKHRLDLVSGAIVFSVFCMPFLPGCGNARHDPGVTADPPPEALSPSVVEPDAEEDAYREFLARLGAERFRQEHPEIIEQLDGEEPNGRITALHVIAAGGDVDAIPLIVPLVFEDGDRVVRITAAYALQKMVVDHELNRRDPNHLDRVVILSAGPDDLDLKPMAWLVRRLLDAPDDGNTRAYAATMAGHLGLQQFRPQLRSLLESPHASVARIAAEALKMLDAAPQTQPTQPQVHPPSELDGTRER